MTTLNIIRLARKHLGGEMESSARLCLAQAIELYDNGELESARWHALRSLRYSLGVLHPVYQKAEGK